MNKKLKTELRYAFEPPKSIKKEEFIENFNYPKTTYLDFFIYQVGYIRKRVWCVCALLIFSVLFAFTKIESPKMISDLVWVVAAILPFVALLTITEIARSMSCNMAELEMTCKYGLGNTVIIRACILGISNIFVFILLLSAMAFKVEYSFVRLAAYLLVPYLLTCVGSLFVLNKVNGKEAISYCGGISCFISILNSILINTKQIIYSDNFVYLWMIIFVLSCLVIFVQGRKFVKKTEELQWSLLLID